MKPQNGKCDYNNFKIFSKTMYFKYANALTKKKKIPETSITNT